MTLRYKTQTSAQRGSIHIQDDGFQRVRTDGKELLVDLSQFCAGTSDSFVQVHTRTEDLTSGADEDGADVLVVLPLRDCLDDLRAHVGIQRITLVRPV